MMNKISTGWTERKKKFTKAINYAKCGEIEKELENESAKLLSEILSTENMNRISSYCNQCGEYYFVEIGGAEPKIRCMRCKVGRHNCDAIIIDNKILNEAGLYWFCDECNEQFMIEYINKFDKNAHFKVFNPLWTK